MCIIPNAFTEQEVETLKSVAKGSEEQVAMVGDPNTGGADDKNIRSGNVKWFTNHEYERKIPDLYKKIFQIVEDANTQSNWNHQFEFIENFGKRQFHSNACSELPPIKPVRKFNLAMGQSG